MKKNYIIPNTMNTETLNLHSYMQSASNPHLDDDGNPTFPGGDGEGGDAGEEAVAKGRNSAWQAGGLWVVAFLMMMLSSSSAWAQDIETQSPAAPPSDFEQHAMKLYLADGTTITFAEEDITSVTYLIGVGMKITTTTTTADYLFSEMTSVDYYLTSGSGGEGAGETQPVTGDNINANWNITGYNIPETEPSISASISSYKYASRLEYPHINTDGNSQVVVRYIDSTYGISYSVEWDNSLVANRWTCYTMNATNGENNVSRSDAFKEDPLLPSATRSTLDDYSGSGYSRGHLCPAADRKCTTTAVKETCFLSNIQPQWQGHNGGVWATLEGKIRTWNDNQYREGDLYVVKGATISNVSTTSSFNPSSGTSGVFPQKCNNRLLVPRYFFMAVLAKKSGTWHAMGIWSPHTETTNSLTEYITIDELEARTGIDFFCNLVDVEEADVEARIEKSFWGVSSSAKERLDDDFFVPEEEELDGEEELEIALW